MLIYYFSKLFIAVKTIVVKGKAPVDPECAAHSTMHVFNEGNDLYDAMLNQVFAALSIHCFMCLPTKEDPPH